MCGSWSLWVGILLLLGGGCRGDLILRCAGGAKTKTQGQTGGVVNRPPYGRSRGGANSHTHGYTGGVVNPPPYAIGRLFTVAARTASRVVFFTLYMASSARWSRSALVFESPGYEATPTLAVIFTSRPAVCSQTVSRIRLCRRGATRMAFSFEVCGSRTTNSSPP